MYVNAMLGVGGDVGYGGCEPRIEGKMKQVAQRATMHVLDTYKFKMDQINSKREIVKSSIF